MPTVMMMMILGMRSRDMFVQGPCTALPSQANGRGASGDLAVAPQQKQGVGKTNTAPADSPHGSVCSFIWTSRWRESILHRMSEFSHSLPFHHCIDFFSPLNSNLLFTSSLQSVHGKTRLVCF